MLNAFFIHGKKGEKSASSYDYYKRSTAELNASATL